jgi:hypothetical protein
LEPLSTAVKKTLGRKPPGVEKPRKEVKYGGFLSGSMARIQAENKAAPTKLYIDPKRTASGASARAGKMNLKAVAEVLMEQGLDPTVEIVKILKAGTLEADVQARVLMTLMEFVHAKKKSVEISGADGGAIQIEHVSDAALMKIAMQALPNADVIDV